MSNMNQNFVHAFGTVTDINDPKKLGRVRVHCIALDGTHPERNSDWYSIIKNPDGFGADGSSPPQVGTTVQLQYSVDNPSIRFITGIIGTQLRSPGPISGNRPLNDITDPYRQKINTEIAGPPDWNYTLAPNANSEVPKVTSEEGDSGHEKSVKEKEEGPTVNSNRNQSVPRDPPITNVATALENLENIMTSELNSMLPGLPFGLGNLFQFITGDLLDELVGTLPDELVTAMQNFVASSSNFTPISGAHGFTMNSNRVNPATFAINAVASLKNVQTHGELFSALMNLETDDAIKDLGSMTSISLNLNGAFGSLPAILNADGSLVINNSSISSFFTSFMSSAGSIPAIGGEDIFQKNSSIPSTLIPRFEKEMQTNIKEIYNTLSNGPKRNKVHSKVSSLKTRLH
jgi:hypothetical protein